MVRVKPENLVQLLAGVAIVLLLWSFSYPFLVMPSDDILADLLTLNGYGAVISPPRWLGYVYFGTHALSLIGLVFAQRWGKPFFLIVVLVFLFLGLFFGVGIARPPEILGATLLGFVYGAIALLLIRPDLVERSESTP